MSPKIGDRIVRSQERFVEGMAPGSQYKNQQGWSGWEWDGTKWVQYLRGEPTGRTAKTQADTNIATSLLKKMYVPFFQGAKDKIKKVHTWSSNKALEKKAEELKRIIGSGTEDNPEFIGRHNKRGMLKLRPNPNFNPETNVTKNTDTKTKEKTDNKTNNFDTNLLFN